MVQRLAAVSLLLCYAVVSGFYVKDLSRSTRRQRSRRFMEPVDPMSQRGYFSGPSHPVAINGDASRQNSLTRAIDDIQQQYGSESCSLVSKTDDPPNNARPVNSLVFSVSFPGSHENGYLLAILHQDDIASRSALQDAAARFLERSDVSVRLAPSHKVGVLCGFEPGTVPPLGLSPAPLMTLVEESLVQENDDDCFLLGGGGVTDASCLVRLDVLQKQPNVHVSAFRRQPWPSPRSSPTSLTSNQELVLQAKPFFAVAPPSTEMVRQILSQTTVDDRPSLSPEPFAVVGRIRIIRRMARQLSFCDLGPPTEAVDASNDNQTTIHLPWRSPTTGQDMAVQLILGKTLCQRLGPEQGVATIKSLRVGDLVLVQGMTNIGNRDSLQNWLDKACFDLVVWSIQSLEDSKLKPIVPALVQLKSAAKRLPKQPVRLSPGMSYLSIQDLYGEPEDDGDELSNVIMVNSLDSVLAFAADLSKLQSSLSMAADGQRNFGLVGLDTEWRPSFLFNNPNEPQVVLLLQICLHPLKQVYVLDLQAVLRPLRSPNEPMNPLETQVSQAVSNLFVSQDLFKVGFQLTNDLRRLAASYPHIPAFREVQAVLETSTLAKTVMRLKKLGNLREVTSSLSRLTERFIGKTINKDNQCSDWSIRPLTAEQVEYAALDAIVTPCLVEKLLSVAEAQVLLGEKPKVGRWKDDTSFTGCISSMRFLFLDPDADPTAVRKLNAKRVIGSPYIVSQYWNTGCDPPQLPTLPTESDGKYTGTDGILRIPSRIITFKRSSLERLFESMLGEYVGKSKERCLASLLTGEASLPDGAKLEFPQRSGFVEFMNAVALFVNMPASNRGSPRSYPNEWRNGGRTLTWFLRESDWKQGTSPLARKLCSEAASQSDPSLVMLFVRARDGHFVCCGFCDVQAAGRFQNESFGEGTSDPESSRDWDLVQLQLHLMDYERLRTSPDFVDMTSSTR